MRFAQPGWLPAGAVVCVLIFWLWRRHDARQQAALAQFVSIHLRRELTRSISTVRRRLRRGLYVAAAALLFVALAGPLVGFRWEEISRRGNEIVFAIDTSRSMSTPDIKPDRLTRAKLAIDDFANRLDGDAVGIVAFAGSAFMVCPITLDYGAFHESLAAVDTRTIPRGGTNIASAIREAEEALRRRPSSDKILVLITDGEDLEGSALSAAKAAKQQDGLTIFAVGVGTASGELIPIAPDQGGGFVKDPTGSYVKSRLDEAGLKAIAEATGGFYVPLGAQGEGLDTVLKNGLGPLAKHALASRRQKIYIERYQWPLTGALAALLLSLMVGSRRRASRPAAPAPAGAAASSFVLATLLVGSLGLTPLRTSNAASTTPVESYNQGIAAYRAGQFPQAAQAFQQSISRAPSNDTRRLEDQEDAYYDLGNTLYRAGQKTEQSAPKDALKAWNDAVKSYETALQLRSDDTDAKFNRDFVKRKIEALQQQQQQQQQNQNKNQNKNDNQDQQQKQGQGQPAAPGQPQAQQQLQNGAPPPPAQQQPAPQNGVRSKGQPPSKDGGQSTRNDTPRGSPDQQADAAARAADNERPPGQMSREEARELLDSVKSDERRPPGVPLAEQSDQDRQQDSPLKNW